MTPSEIDQSIMLEAMKVWPEGARDKRVLLVPHVLESGDYIGVVGVHPYAAGEIAALMFTATGLLELGRTGVVNYWHCGDHWHLDHRRKMSGAYHGEHNDSLLYLIHKAIMASIPHSSPTGEKS